ncbi:hypothetical protein [Spongiivirga citrea]|uniref:Uncharacterized protein n=1 Tax=Spongiivirga citrea TaxID=1481457 RepID=A0A6M0CKP0_9FLAO|nr:hypothetical protein [Spongiivirga citrea]NER16419.1 hypothetical protein [Spongiivirga citrea]
MGRPATKPTKLMDGFYIELRNRGASSGVKIMRETEAQMLQSAQQYKKTKDVVILGESKNGKFINDPKVLSA